MFNDIVNSIPIVGHVNSLRHYINGNKAEAKRSFYEASRSSAVMAGGAAGAMLGPAALAAMAAAGGALVDAGTTLITDEAVGVVSNINDICTDISNGETPIESSIRTGLTIGTDIIGGNTGRGLSKYGSKCAKTYFSGVKTAVGTRYVYGAARSYLADEERGRSRRYSQSDSSQASSSSEDESPADQESSKNRTRKGGTSRDGSDSSNKRNERQSDRYQQSDKSGSYEPDFGGAGGQPPNNNNNDKKKKDESKPVRSDWEVLLELLWNCNLQDRAINGIPIFKDMNVWQKKEVKNLIRSVKLNYGHLGLGNIIIITEALLRQVDDDHVTSHNFTNVAKFVIAYLSDVLTEIHEANRDCTEDYETSRDRIAYQITEENSYVIHNLFTVFETLWREIEYLMTTTDPQFVNIIAAIYHYYKHKFIKSKNIFLTPQEYFQLAGEALPRLWSLFFNLLHGQGVQVIVYERYDAKVGRRIKIVVKKQYNGWTLSSVYYEDDIYDGDQDGDEWINGMKVPFDIFIPNFY